MRKVIGNRWVLGLTLLLALVAAGSRLDSGFAEPGPKRHPALEAFLEAHPATPVPAIVQARGQTPQLAERLRSDGATDVVELPMIGAVAATLTPAQVSRLGTNPDVEWITLDARMVSSDQPGTTEPSKLATAYPAAAGVPPAWQAGLTGEGVTVAVIDSGLATGKDFTGRVAASLDFSSLSDGLADENGHGTYVAGIIGADNEKFMGIAPHARLVSLKVSGRDGSALVSDVVSALQWSVDHRDEFGIRVINISLNSSIPDSYRQDPLSAAVEQAWFHGIVVVTSAGNLGADPFAVDHAPANDPYVITVGAFDDAGTTASSDDSMAPWSSRGRTADGYAKPELVAPGVHVTATLAKKSLIAAEPQSNKVEGHYVTLSGTSASAAVVSGVVALMLQDDPTLTPDRVKYLLTSTGGNMAGSGGVRVDAFAAVNSGAQGAANQDAQPNVLIDPHTGDIVYDSVLWRSVLWHSVLWHSVETNVLWRG